MPVHRQGDAGASKVSVRWTTHFRPRTDRHAIGVPSSTFSTTRLQRIDARAPKLSVHCIHDLAPSRMRSGVPRTDPRIARVAAEAGVSVPTVSKVINGRVGRVARDPAPRRGGRSGNRATTARTGSNGRHRSSSSSSTNWRAEWALEIVRGVEHVAGQHHLAVVLSEMQGRRTPGRGWIEGVAGAPSDGGHRGLLRPQRVDADAAADPRHPVRRGRPDRRAAPRHAIDRCDQLERRPDRDPSPTRPRASAHRGRRRTRGDPVQPGPDGRLPRRDGCGRRAGRPAS